VPMYYVDRNAGPRGEHAVHKASGCPTSPLDVRDRYYLGEFATCQEAVGEAKRVYATAAGCAACSPECHTP
jgi:hypothetical protein